MAADILIGHCTLRIARRGGWSWGADARALLRAALERLPELLATRLSESWPAQHDCEVAAPLRLHLSVRLDELLELAAQSHGSQPAGAHSSALAQRLDAMLLALVQRESSGVPSTSPRAPEPVAQIAAPDASVLWAGTVLTVLLGWHRQAILHEQLLMFSQAALASWHASLLQARLSPDQERQPAALAALAAEHAALPLPLPAGVRASMVRRIGLMVAAAGECGVAAGDPAFAKVLAAHREFDLEPVVPATPAGAPLPATSADAAPIAMLRTHASSSVHARAPLVRFDVKVCSALPFLLLGPLSRTGYLQTLGAVFEAAQMLPALPALAVALARKVLEPPGRGWFRSAQSVTAAAAFAGLPEAPPDTDIADMARLLAPLVSPLDAVVASVLTAGHVPGSTLVLQAAPPGWVLCEAQGMFPIACAAKVEHLFARMAALGGELLLVPEAALSAGLLARLDSAGFRFITDARPARGEKWRGLFFGPLRAWTNDRESAPPVLAAATANLQHAGSASAQLWQALTNERALLGGAAFPELERSMALAAALALGTIAWSLWRDRETVTPLLTLERFADIDARVSFRPDLVQVHLPLGRRFMDLKRAGWLDDIEGVPWLDGRPLRFAQG